MDEAKAFLLGLMQTARERFGNPLIGAIAISWALWNFRLLLVLIGEGEGGWEAKITYIDTRLMPNRWDWALHGFLIPSLAALAWIYLLPPILRRVATDHEKNLNRSRNAIFTATEARILSAEEALYLREVMVKQRAEWQTEKAETVQSLENLVKKLDTANDSFNAAIKREHERAKEVEALQAEIEKLKAPPPRKPYDFHGKEAKEKASILGLQLLNSPPVCEESPLVTFGGFPVQWPWAPTENKLFDIPHKRLIEHPLDEQTIAAMLHILQQYPTGSKKRDTDAWARELRDAGFSKTDSLVRHLLLHGALSGLTAMPEFSVHQVGSIRWLQQVGFSLTNRQAAPK